MTRSDANQSDALVVGRCAAGDAQALELLYARHSGTCLAFARQVLVDAHFAEDAVQEAFLHLWRNAASFDGTRSSARTWLVMLTRSRAIDRVRYEQRRATTVLAERHDQADDAPGPDALAISAVLGQHAREAFAVLPVAKREVLVLAYWGGYTQREIAAITGAPLGTVKTRMRDALATLAEHLVPQGDLSRQGAMT